MRFPAAPVVGRDFLTPGHSGIRVRNVRRKSGPKSLCLCCFFFPEINRKHINIFLTALGGQSSQGRTPPRPRDKRDKMAILLWNQTEKGQFVPGTGPILSRGGVPFLPGTVPLSRTPSRRKCLCLLVFFLPDQRRAPSGSRNLEGPTRKPRHASVFSTRTPTRKRFLHSTVNTIVFKGIFWTR